MKQRLYRFIFFRLMGWKIRGTIAPELRQCVMIVVPHTSWQDFFIGLFARGIIGLEMHWVGKKELFRFPLGAYFRWMGGEPLDRRGGLNTVDAISGVFKRRKVFRLAISPEGTRKKVTQWKTGFYYIALNAGVPIVPVAFDFGRKEVRIDAPFHPTGNLSEDLPTLMRRFQDVRGRHPHNSFIFEAE